MDAVELRGHKRCLGVEDKRHGRSVFVREVKIDGESRARFPTWEALAVLKCRAGQRLGIPMCEGGQDWDGPVRRRTI